MGNPVWYLPKGASGPCRTDPLLIDEKGHSRHPKITDKITGNLARGDLEKISGIIVHQTGASTAQSTFNSYGNKNANGAHFLIAKDGAIYQTASVHKMTWHVGKLKSKCLAEGKCDPVDPKARTAEEEIKYIKSLGYTERHKYEKKKSIPDRYPMNSDSIGIELVGEPDGKDPNNPGSLLYVTVTE